jgi:hypothetical protein
MPRTPDADCHQGHRTRRVVRGGGPAPAGIDTFKTRLRDASLRWTWPVADRRIQTD